MFAWIKNSCDAEARSNHDESDCDSSDEDVVVNPLNGLLAAVQTAPGDYIHRCHPGDTSHPFYSMSYFTYTQLVRSKDATGAKRKRARCDDGDKEQRRRGRLSVEQYSFHGDYRPGAAQLLRATPALLNLMRKPPLEGANAEGFARLLLVLVKPFFIARDLLPVGSSSWHYLHKHMGEHDWDSRVKPVRANIANKQTGRLANCAVRLRRKKAAFILFQRTNFSTPTARIRVLVAIAM